MPWTNVGELRQMQTASKSANAWYPYLYVNNGGVLVGGFGTSDMTPYDHGSYWEVYHGLMTVHGRINFGGGVNPMPPTGYTGELWTSLPNWSNPSIPAPTSAVTYRIVGQWWMGTWPSTMGGFGLCELTFQSPVESAGAVKFHINRYHDTLSILSSGASVPYYFDSGSALSYTLQYEVA